MTEMDAWIKMMSTFGWWRRLAWACVLCVGVLVSYALAGVAIVFVSGGELERGAIAGAVFGAGAIAYGFGRAFYKYRKSVLLAREIARSVHDSIVKGTPIATRVGLPGGPVVSFDQIRELGREAMRKHGIGAAPIQYDVDHASFEARGFGPSDLLELRQRGCRCAFEVLRDEGEHRADCPITRGAA